MNIANNLETTEEGYALDARQGKVLGKTIEVLKSDKAPIKSPQFNEIYIRNCRILEANSGLIFYVGDHSFTFNRNGSIWIDNTLIGVAK